MAVSNELALSASLFVCLCSGSSGWASRRKWTACLRGPCSSAAESPVPPSKGNSWQAETAYRTRSFAAASWADLTETQKSQRECRRPFYFTYLPPAVFSLTSTCFIPVGCGSPARHEIPRLSVSPLFVEKSHFSEAAVSHLTCCSAVLTPIKAPWHLEKMQNSLARNRRVCQRSKVHSAVTHNKCLSIRSGTVNVSRVTVNLTRCPVIALKLN